MTKLSSNEAGTGSIFKPKQYYVTCIPVLNIFNSSWYSEKRGNVCFVAWLLEVIILKSACLSSGEAKSVSTEKKKFTSKNRQIGGIFHRGIGESG